MIKLITQAIKNKKSSVKLCLKSLGLVYNEAPWQVGFLLCGIILQGLIPTATIWLTSHLIGVISKPHAYSHVNVLLLCAMWAGSLLLANLITPFILCWQGNISDKAVNKVNMSIIKKSNEIHSLAYFETPEFYNDIQILQSQSANKPINLVVTIVGLMRDLITAFSCLILLWSVMPWVSLIALASGYINFKVYAVLQKKTWQESLGRSMESRRLSYISSLSINNQYAKELRFFDFGAYLIKEYSHLFSAIYTKMQRLRFKQAVWPFLPFILTVFGNLIAFSAVVTAAFHGQIGVGAVVLFLQSLSQLHLSITDFGEQAGWVKGHVLFFEKFFNFMQIKGSVYLPPTNKTPLHTNEISIKFDNVYFSYPQQNAILEAVSFTIQPQEKIAILGLNGAGKSTLIKLLCGLYSPTSGSISINGLPLENLDMREWRKKISPVFQDFNAYAFSIEQNIVMGSEERDHAKFTTAIAKAGVDKFLHFFPNGKQELLGKDFGGIDLSKGQWQKIAIARALYKDAPIFILDEPSSSLDALGEHEIFHQILSSTTHKTILFVTHRLSSIALADRILFFHDGKLLSEGSHAQLILNNPIYREMFEKQAGGYFALQEMV